MRGTAWLKSVLVTAAALSLQTRADLTPLATMPRTVVWAWEQPIDLRAAPTSVGVAYLAETLVLRPGAFAIVPRHQPLATAPGAPIMAVIRIEGQGSDPSNIAAEILKVARRPALRALQIDFDAGLSQRPFYADLLREVRAGLPPGVGLSITALLSWCGPGSWLQGLPIDEAVPMYFRARVDTSRIPITEPLCRTSAGLSTDEPWPALDPARRIYLFAPRPWTPAQIAALPAIPATRPAALRQPYFRPTEQAQ